MRCSACPIFFFHTRSRNVNKQNKTDPRKTMPEVPTPEDLLRLYGTRARRRPGATLMGLFLLVVVLEIVVILGRLAFSSHLN